MTATLLFLALALPATAGDDGSAPLPRAELLVSEHGCGACHALTEAAAERIDSKAAPRLAGVATRAHPAWMRTFLEAPSTVQPGTTMPDALAGLPAEQRVAVAEDLTHFLATLGEPLDLAPTAVSPAEFERGRHLYHEVGCVACHGALEEPWALSESFLDAAAARAEPVEGGDADEPPDEEELFLPPGTLPPSAVPLGALGAKTSIGPLTEFLLDPLAVRPSGRMPSMQLERDEARAIAVYLLGEQSDVWSGELQPSPGLAVEYFEEPSFPARPDFDALTPKRKGIADGFSIADRDRDNQFGFRFSGFIELPASGEYAFFIRSDDGSQLWIDDLHVDNGGVHGAKEMSGSLTRDAGRYPITVTMYEAGGGELLEVAWTGPGFERGPIPPEALSHMGLKLEPPALGSWSPDPARVAAGERHFRSLGCVHCHETGTALDSQPRDRPTPFAELDPDARAGCLGPEPRAGAPRFRLDAADEAAVRAAIKGHAEWDAPLDPSLAVQHRLGRLNCYACHRRDDFGGVHPTIGDYFVADEDAELGDEGRIPPHLSGVGAKLREPWLRAVLLEGGAVRPYMATRMPDFGRANVEPLVALFLAADHPPPPEAETAPAAATIDAGRDLAGTQGGLGCIQCHTFAGARSLGVQAVDLTNMHARLQRPWFEALLRDPKSLNMNTRMAELFTDGKSPAAHFGGDSEQQIDALWAYLSLGTAMGYPPGLVPPRGTYDLVPTDGPITAGVFMRDVSPRVVCVGFPERVHYAFDVQNSLLARVWRGDFLNVEGTWHGRAGALEVPAGGDVLEMDGRYALALARGDGEGEDARRPLGRRFDEAGRPTFRYMLGEVTVEETLAPAYVGSGVGFVRSIRATAASSFRGALLLPETDGDIRTIPFIRDADDPEDAPLTASASTEVIW